MGEVVFERRGGLAVATLNRPAALNALTLEMFRALAAQVAAWEHDPAVRAMVVRGSGRAFCAGGDVLAVHGRERGYAPELFAAEYRFVRQVHLLGTPWIALCDGYTMGGGCGISVNGSHRVATERSVFAMPEVQIGSIPDVGATRFLNRCPGQVGMYLGLTGARIGAADAVYCGLATHFVPSARLGEIDGVEALERLRAGPGPAPLRALQGAIDRCFGKGSVAEIRAALRSEAAPWSDEALAAMDRAAPLSLELVFRQLRRGAELDLEGALALEYRLMQHLLRGRDFHEGVRALLIDRDRRPRWQREFGERDVEAYFEPLGPGEMVFPGPRKK